MAESAADFCVSLVMEGLFRNDNCLLKGTVWIERERHLIIRNWKNVHDILQLDNIGQHQNRNGRLSSGSRKVDGGEI